MLPLSRTSQYAIRTLTYLAQQGTSEYHLTRVVAERLEVPGPFLTKVLQPLVLRGLVDSQRGRAGGIRLAKRPEDITMFEIVDALEHLRRPRECILGQSECSDERACPFHASWTEAWKHREKLLSTRTLADMTEFCAQRPDSGYPLP